MRRIAILLCLILTLPVVVAEIDTTVDITYERKIENLDLGINGGAVSPLGDTVLIYGADGYAHIVSAENAENPNFDVSLENETTEELHSASWHPAGKSALIVGDAGVVLRYNSTTYALAEAEGSSAISGQDLRSIKFTPGSSVAYIGTESGQIWKYFADTFTMIDDEASSMVTDIECLKNENICLVSTVSNGIAVIDQADKVTWISNSRFYTWVGISCQDPLSTFCTIFGSGKKVAEIDVDTQDTSNSMMGQVDDFPKLQGDFITSDSAFGSSTIVAVGPLSMMRYTQHNKDSFLMFSNDNATDEDVFLGGDSYGFAWETSKNTGYLITSYGRVVSFTPTEVDSIGFVPGIVIFLIALSVPGVFLGMIYWNSPYLQRKYAQLVGRKKSDEK